MKSKPFVFFTVFVALLSVHEVSAVEAGHNFLRIIGSPSGLDRGELKARQDQVERIVLQHKNQIAFCLEETQLQFKIEKSVIIVPTFEVNDRGEFLFEVSHRTFSPFLIYDKSDSASDVAAARAFSDCVVPHLKTFRAPQFKDSVLFSLPMKLSSKSVSFVVE